MTFFALFSLLSLASAQDPSAWTTLPSPGASPSPRVDGTLAFDSATRTLYLFGGRDGTPRNDLWSYSLQRQEWTELRPSGPLPPARFGHTLLYDTRRSRLILFGGQAGGFFSDTWAFDPASQSWRALAADNAGPSRRYGHSAVYDAAGDRMLISHGFTDAGRFDDTWAFDLSTNRWRDVSPAPGTRPLRRCLHHAVLDEAGGQMLLYGGCSSGFGPCPQGDLWSFDLTAHRWTEIRSATKPPGRQWYGGAFDSDARRLLIFGGSGDSGNRNDLWSFHPASATWSQLSQPAPPEARERHESVFVPGLGAVFFGGVTDRGLSSELLLLPTTPAIGNALSQREGPVAPGGLVTIASPGENASATVRFNGIVAPTIATASGSITVQTPYEVSGLTTVTITLDREALPTTIIQAAVAEVSPGIPPRLTATAGGLLIPLTGAGNLLPPVATGAIDDSGLSAPAAPVTVSVDGGEIAPVTIRHSLTTPGILELWIGLPPAAALPQRVTVTVGGNSTASTLVAAELL